MFYIIVAAYLAGILSAVVTLLYLFSNESEPPKKHIIVEAKLPQSLDEELKHPDGYQRRETCISLNLLLQFLFQEKLHDITIHHWLTDKLNDEFSELLKHKTLSKIIHRMEIQNLSLGNNFPVIKAATPSLVKFVKDSSVLDDVHLDFELDYMGGFDLTIDAYSRIAKKAIVKIKVDKLSGTARLLFSRQPFSHWGFTFNEEPEVKFDIQSSVLGHHIPKFKSIIDNQLRNVIRRKYVIPYYKIRMSPLIQNLLPELVPKLDTGIVIAGKLSLCVVKFSRLQECLLGTSMWCTISVAETPVVCVYENQKEVWAILDVDVTKKYHVPIGFVLKPGADFQVVDSISAQSPAFQAGIKKGDMVVGVNGQLQTSGTHTARLIADSWNRDDDSAVVIRVKRFVICNKKTSSDQLTNKEDGTISNESHTRPVDEGFDKTDTKEETGSVDETSETNTSPESENKFLLAEDGDALEDDNRGESAKKFHHSLRSEKEPKSEEKTTESLNTSGDAKTEFKYVARRFPFKCRPILKYFESSSFDRDSNPCINAECDMSLDEDFKFINVSLWSYGAKPKVSPEKSPLRERRRRLINKQSSQEVRSPPDECMFSEENGTLIGYVNFSVENLIDQCSLNTLGHVIKVVYLKPANPLCPTAMDHPLVTHKGFEGEQCYGDVMLSVLHTPVVGSQLKDHSCQSDDDYPSDASVSDEDDESVVGQEKEHAFKRTHFSSATHCDFCRKKIWLKDAVQCSVCGIICHKKCMARCRQATACDLSGLRYKEIRDLAVADMPEIVMPDEEEEPHRRNSQVQTTKHTLGALLNQVGSATGSYISGSGLKRVGSAHNLAPPLNSDGSSVSRSLPPSPHHSPRHSRKASLCENPFLLECPADDLESYLEKSLEYVLSYPHIDSLHRLAKQSAAELLSQYDRKDRAGKIDSALQILQKRISKEGLTRRDLAKREKDAYDGGNAIEHSRMSLLIAECDSRTQALALIAMQYFTAQQLMEAEEPLLVDVPKKT